MVRVYYNLAKPGLVYGNCLTGMAGFLLASQAHVNFLLLLETIAGLGLVMASACVLNNVYDADIDSKMERTKTRATVTGEISKFNASIYGILLGLAGYSLLYFYTNLLTVGVAAVGTIVYLLFYSPFKRRSTMATIVGGLSGATPPVIGYCAVTNNFDLGALLLFLILFFWQLPHFYAISIYRLGDYTAAAVPVMSVKKGIRVTKFNILVCVIGFIASTISLKLYGYIGLVSIIIVGIVSLNWLRLALKGFSAENDVKWARKMFFFSLIVLLTLSAMLSLDALLI